MDIKRTPHTRDASFGPGMFAAMGEEADEESGGGGRGYSRGWKARISKKRAARKKVVTQYLPPKENDHQLAKAYGGKARGKIRRAVQDRSPLT